MSKKTYSLGERFLALYLSAVLVLGIIPVNQAAAAEGFAFDNQNPVVDYEDGLTYANTLKGVGEGDVVTYTITSGAEFADINEETGVLTVSGPGAVTVKAVKTAADDSGEPEEAEYTLTIRTPKFAFQIEAPAPLAYEEGLTYTNEAMGGEGDDKVTYALLTKKEVEKDPEEDPDAEPEFVIVEVETTDVAEIDPITGELTILRPGTVMVRAKKDGNESVQYTLAVELGEQTTFMFEVEEAWFGYSATEKYTSIPVGGESTGEVTYAITEGNQYAAIDANTGAVTTHGVGTIVVTATKAGDEKFKSATASYTLGIVKGIQTDFGFEKANPDSIVFAEGLTFTNKAHGGQVEGVEITYTVTAGTDVATVDAEGKLTILKNGVVTVAATKAGNELYNDATASYTLVVTKVPQTGFAFEDPAPAARDYEENLTITNIAVGGQGEGAVTYSVTEGTGVATVNKTTGALTVLKHGSVTVKATKAEDDYYAQAEAFYTLTINGLKQEALVFETPEPEMMALEGATANFWNKATGGSGNGSITYAVSEGRDIAQIEPSTGWLTITGKGTIVVTATKAADNAYEATSASYTLVVGEPQEPFTFGNKNPEITYAPGATYQQAPEGGSGEGMVSYSIRPQDYAVVEITDWSNGTLKVKKAGEVVVTATKAAEGGFAPASTQYTLTIKKAEQTNFGFAQNKATMVYGENDNRFILETIGGESTKDVTYTVQAAEGTVEQNGNVLLIKKAGEILVTAVKAGDQNYLDSTPATLMLTVQKASQTITFAESEIQETYGILEYTQKAVVLGACNDQNVIYNIEGENHIGATIDEKTGMLTFSDSADKVGSITVRATKPDDDCYEEAFAEYTFTLSYEKTPEMPYTLSGEKKNNSGWFTGDVTIIPAEGYLISTHNWLSTEADAWEESIVETREGSVDFTVYLKNSATGRITDAIVINDLKIDKTAPVALKIEYSISVWHQILERLFGFSQNTVEVKFSGNDVTSGVEKVAYSIDGGETYTVLEEGVSGYMCSISAQYRNKVALKITDVAGNESVVVGDEANNDKTLVVDSEQPILTGGFNVATSDCIEHNIHFTNSETLEATIRVTDANYDLEGERVPVVTLNGENQILNWTYSATAKEKKTGETSIILPDEGEYIITADFTDRAGNVADQYKTVVYVDRTAPVIEPGFNNVWKQNADDGIYYSNAAVPVVTFKVSDDYYGCTLQNPVVKVNGTEQTDLAWTMSDDYGQTTLSFAEDGHYEVTVDYTDISGNAAETYRANFWVDKQKPERSVNISTPARIVDKLTMTDVLTFAEGDNVVTYYNDDVEAEIVITEKNFEDEDVIIQVNGTALADVVWAESGTDSWKYTVSLVEEGDYIIEVAYTDRAGNVMEAYTSRQIVIDKTEPKISAAFSNTDVKHAIDEREYFAADQTITLTIQEHNFRADDVRVIVSGEDADSQTLELKADGTVTYEDKGKDRAAWTAYKEGTWRNENDTYVLTLPFSVDANYSFDVEYVDLATNAANDYREYLFTVDKTLPEIIDIQYSDPVYEEVEGGVTYKYYQDTATVNLSAEDVTAGLHYFNYSYKNEPDVSSVNAELLDQRIDAVRNGAKGTATFTIPKDKLEKTNQFNGKVSVTAADRSENKQPKNDDVRIIVDSINPITEITYNNPVQPEKIDKNTKVAYYADDINATIKITEANFFPEEVNITVTKDGTAVEKDKVKVEWKHNSVDEHIGTFTLTEEGHYEIAVSYSDKSSNVQVDSEGNEMDPYTSCKLVLDRQAPVDLGIIYEKEQPASENSFPNEIVEALKKVFYYHKATKVTLTATDANSGMEGIALNITKEGAGAATTIDLPEDLMILSNGNINGKTGAIKVVKVDYDEATGKMSAVCEIPEEFRGELDIVAVDRSHNTASYRDPDNVVVVVDSIPPVRSVTYGTNRVVDAKTMRDVVVDDEHPLKETDDVVLYFRNRAVVNFKITEANFYGEDIKIEVFKDGNTEGTILEHTWTKDEKEDDVWNVTATWFEEGDYILKASYTDRSRNEMTSYTSQRIVVDNTKPEITTTCSNKNVKNLIDGRQYLDADQTITITIKEHNFRADDVNVIVSGKDAKGNVLTLKADGTVTYEEKGRDRTAWTAYKEGTWRNENDTYELKLTFAADANYTFDVEYEDLATNAAEDFATYAFTVDKTAPTGLRISYSQSVLETVLNAISFGFYREKVTVDIDAADATAGIHYFVYNYRKAANVSSVNAELTNQRVNIKTADGTGHARFTIPKDELNRRNQFNGNVSFSAYDRSENSASIADNKRIVVDNISPTATVKYNAASKTVKEKTYYNDEIICTIEMNEANFYAEDVKVMVTKDGKEYAVTVSWERSSPDLNIGKFILKEDGEYVISIQYTDKSGNKMVDYLSETHVLDTVKPVIKVSNIKANSANKDEKYGFVIDISDINLDPTTMQPILTAVVKDEKGIYTVKEIALGDPTARVENKHYTYTVENLEEDALYKLVCSVKDLAENEAFEILLDDEQLYQEVNFSINRNGSTFGYGNDFSEKLVGQYYVYSVLDDVVIVEVNVDPIENYVVKLNGKELTEGQDYTTTQTSNKDEWSKRVYYIHKDLFEAEGEYGIVVSSVDKAETTAYSDVKNLTVAFVVDQTKPVVTINGLETGGRYQTDLQTVTLIPTDEGGRLRSLCVILLDSNGNPLRNEAGEDISVRFAMSDEELLKYLEENDGKIQFTIPEGLNNQVRIICNDCAVNADNQTNEYNELFVRVTVSQNKFIIFYANRPLFYGTIAGTVGLLALLVFLLTKRRRKAA